MTITLSDAFTGAYALAYTARVAQRNATGVGAWSVREVCDALTAGALQWAATLSDRQIDRGELLTVAPINASPSLEVSHPLALAERVQVALTNYQHLLSALRVVYVDDPLTLAVVTDVQREVAHHVRTFIALRG